MFSPSQVLVYLQVCKNISLVFLGDWQKVTNHVCAVTRALAKRPLRYGATLNRSGKCPSDGTRLLHFFFFFQTADRASRAAVLHGGFVGQWSSCGERRIRAGSGLEESAAAAE